MSNTSSTKNALNTANFLAAAGFDEAAKAVIAKAFKTKAAQQKHIAALPERDKSIKSVAVIVSANGVEILPRYPKGQGVHKLGRGELFAAAPAAKILANGATVDRDARDHVRVNFPEGENTHVLAWVSVDPRKGLVKQIRVDEFGFTRTREFVNAAVSAKIGWVRRLAEDGGEYGDIIATDTRLAHYIDGLMSVDSKARYFTGAVTRRAYREAKREAGGDADAVKAQLRRYRLVYESGATKEVNIAPNAVERLLALSGIKAVEPIEA